MVRIVKNNDGTWKWLCVCGAESRKLPSRSAAEADHLEHELQAHGE